MLRWIGFGIIVVVLVIAVSLMSSSERKESEKQYEATLAQYRSALATGSSRSQVENYLQKQNMSFDRACCDQKNTDRAQLGEMPRNLFCQPWKVYLDFQFKGTETPASAPHDSDVLTGIDLHREGVCF